MGSVNPLVQAPPRRAGIELRRPARLVDGEGSAVVAELSADAQVALWCDVVIAGQRGLVEVVRATRDGEGQLRMRSRRDPAGYVDATRRHRIVALVARARGRGEEVFATPVPKHTAEPGRSSATAGRALWVDVDEVSEQRAMPVLEPLRPHLVVHSGGGLHAYWRLAELVSPDELEALNRRLCALAGGDPACTDRGRIMRLPGTFNGRRSRWCRVLSADRSRPPVDPVALAELRPDPDPPAPPATRSSERSYEPDELAAISPPAYFRRICGIEVDPRGGDVRCPLPGHDDRYASCHVYGEPGRGFWCFGCNRGGGIYDLVSLMEGGPWGRELRGDTFKAVREGALAAVWR